MIEKMYKEQKDKADQLKMELDQYPHIKQAKDSIAEAKAPVKSQQKILKTLQKVNLAQIDLMETLNSQVKTLKSKKIMCLNGIDPNIKTINAMKEEVMKENDKISKLKSLNESINSKMVSEKLKKKSRIAELENEIKLIKNTLNESEAKRERSKSRLEHLSPQLLHASAVLKTKIEKFNQDQKTQSELSKVAKREKYIVKNLSRQTNAKCK